MASIIPYTSQTIDLLKNKQANSQGHYNSFSSISNVPSGSEFYESLSMEIDLMLSNFMNENGSMITENSNLEQSKQQLNNNIYNMIYKYRNFVKPDFVDYYEAHHRRDWYADMLGEGYIVNTLRQYC